MALNRSRLGSFDPEKEEFSEDTLRWLRERNAHDLADEFEKKRPSKSAPEEGVDGYDKMTVAQLRKELDDRRSEATAEGADEETVARLSYESGARKDDLISKLREDDKMLAEADSE